MDPVFGAASVTRPPGWSAPYGRVATGVYPIFPCRDGYVRLLVLSPRQWHGMRAWLGEPADLQDPALDSIPGRAAAEDRLYALYAELFRDRGKVEVSEEGQRMGIPVTPVLTVDEVLESRHFLARGAFTDADILPGVRARIPAGFVSSTGVGPGSGSGHRWWASTMPEPGGKLWSARPIDDRAPERHGWASPHARSRESASSTSVRS